MSDSIRGRKKVELNVAGTPAKKTATESPKAFFDTFKVLGLFIVIAVGGYFLVPHAKTEYYDKGVIPIPSLPSLPSFSSSGVNLIVSNKTFDLVFELKNGKVEKRTGGSAAWRANNPGGVTASKSSIGTHNGLAIFATLKEGEGAGGKKVLWKEGTVTYYDDITAYEKAHPTVSKPAVVKPVPRPLPKPAPKKPESLWTE
jgi:hypothetical protein